MGDKAAFKLQYWSSLAQMLVKNQHKVRYMTQRIAMVLIYVGSRFEWRLGWHIVSAHDVIITSGISVLQIEIDLTLLWWIIL